MTSVGSSATGPADLRSGPSATDRREAGPIPVRLGPAAAGRCRRRVHLDADPLAGRSSRAPADDGLRLRLADGALHRDQVMAALRLALSLPESGPLWDPSGPDRPPVVLEPVLRSSARFGTPDVLLWDGAGYRPVVIRSHRTTDPGSGASTSTFPEPLAASVDTARKPRSHPADALALAHHYRLLADLSLASPQAIGGVIGRGAALPVERGRPDRAGDHDLILWHTLDVPASSVLADYDVRFGDRLAVASAAANRAAPLAQPSRIGECRRCPWWPVCSEELSARHDISLIAAGADVSVLQAAGVRTVDELAALPREVVGALPLTGLAPATARVCARAWLAGWPLVRRSDQVVLRRADLELDVDMESFLEDGAYLWGTYLTGPGVRMLGLAPGYRAFVSWRPLPDEDEGRAFAAFWAYLAGLRGLAAEHGLTFAAYCYSRSAEERWLRSTPARYPHLPGMPSAPEITEFCSSTDWVDIYQEIRDQFVVPGSMKLKALAPVAGFAWRDPDPGGANSMAWYRDAVGAGGGGPGSAAPGGAMVGGPVAPVDPASADRILRYNEDDVLATLELRRWMTDRAGEVPTADELDTD